MPASLHNLSETPTFPLTRYRQRTVDLFYHGYDNYMLHAFPEDELKPISCAPLTRDRENVGHFELNDVLGNYSLTLIDSLSTLAIFASASAEITGHRRPLQDFQNGVAYLVSLYGDGSSGPRGQGIRARGFDLDSKVQVFETVIRGVGGLLSAHLFASGDLPIAGYHPYSGSGGRSSGNVTPGITWPNGFAYDGQLLHLAFDLASRLLPAFLTPTGLPYPRVNLQTGIPFYENSPVNQDAERGQCQNDGSHAREVTETCSAGAGSLVLEFSVLSRLTGDGRFERLAKRAFDGIWSRRSVVGLIGAGIDAESGQWVAPYTGIGAGVDSFFEYAMKSHILLSGFPSTFAPNTSVADSYYLSIWQKAHAGIKHHLYRDVAFQHPHYIQGDLYTGATRAFWIDSLSAYYPGLLVMSGELQEAVETHLLFAALWSRYAGLPERWNTATGAIESGLRWWGGRPEFIESTWYLFHATQDPWYLHVGEMVLHDIERRCWQPCGWAGLEDVRTGELKDRMESFFLGETAKYLFLLFDPDHPLNKLDDAYVLSTEGHPLIVPRQSRVKSAVSRPSSGNHTWVEPESQSWCPAPPKHLPLTVSSTAARKDLFHAASLAKLHALGNSSSPPAESSSWDRNYTSLARHSPNNFTFYPWTLPRSLMPAQGFSSRIETKATFDLSFPTLPNVVSGPLTLKRTDEGIIINSVSGLKLGMIRDFEITQELDSSMQRNDIFRIYSVSHLSLGRDEKVFISPEAVSTLNPVDPYFTRHRDISTLDVVIELEMPPLAESGQAPDTVVIDSSKRRINNVTANGTFLQGFLDQISSALQQHLSFEDVVASAGFVEANGAAGLRPLLPATAATGVGAGALPDVADASSDSSAPLLWNSVYIVDEVCPGRLPPGAPKDHQVIVMKRGGCTFSEKMRSIPSFAPSATSLQLVLLVSPPGEELDLPMVRPLLDETQYTPSGILRRNPIPMVMVEGDDKMMEMLKSAKGIGLRRRYHFSSQGLRIGNLFLV